MPAPSTPRGPERKVKQAFTRRLLAWFRRRGRDLPWRRTRDPYRVLVSEFMLQQTQVSRVTEYYPRFLKRFGSLESLARARPRAVREAWDGLGYYARARNLHALAREVVKRPGRTIPSDPAELAKLPGVGRYTAGAVASFAYEKPVAAVDTNVGRVIRRAFFGEGKENGEKRGRREKGEVPSGNKKSREHGAGRQTRSKEHGAVRPGAKATGGSEVWAVAQSLVPKNGERAWRFNQALMELGALICVARKPKCVECPVRGVCRTGRAK